MENQQNDEIDLLQLFARIFLLIRKNLVIIIVAVVCGVVLGLCYYKLAPKSYESKMVVASDVVNMPQGKIIFGNIDQLIGEGDLEFISSELGISQSVASEIQSIKVDITEDKIDATLEKPRISLAISVYSSNPKNWSEIQKGILFYLKHIDFVKVKDAQNKRLLEELIQQVETEIADLQNLKKRFAQVEFHGSNDKLMLFDLTEINSTIILLTKEKLDAIAKLEFSDGIHLVEGFIPSAAPAKPKLTSSLLVGLSIGLLFALAFLFITGIQSMLRSSENRIGKD